MSWQSILMYCVVAGIGFPAAPRNLTAAALVLAWLAGEIIVMVVGDSLPLSFYFMADITVIALIYAKTIRRIGVKTYSTAWSQLRCLVTDLTRYDRWIVAIFIAGMWPLYLLAIDPWVKWMLLWGLSITQFLLAGAEAALSFRHEVKPRARPNPPGDGLAMAGYWRHG